MTGMPYDRFRLALKAQATPRPHGQYRNRVLEDAALEAARNGLPNVTIAATVGLGAHWVSETVRRRRGELLQVGVL